MPNLYFILYVCLKIQHIVDHFLPLEGRDMGLAYVCKEGRVWWNAYFYTGGGGRALKDLRLLTCSRNKKKTPPYQKWLRYISDSPANIFFCIFVINQALRLSCKTAASQHTRVFESFFILLTFSLRMLFLFSKSESSEKRTKRIDKCKSFWISFLDIRIQMSKVNFKSKYNTLSNSDRTHVMDNNIFNM